MRLRLGTRGSALARWQANWVAAALAAAGTPVEIVEIVTQGDRDQSEPIAGQPLQGVFTKEIQRALLAGTVDLAVHSLKDLPTEPVAGLVLAAVPERAPVADVLISRHGRGFAELPAGAVIGTGSARRRAQLLHARADLVMRDIRGNVDTRLRKLAAGDYDAIVLAEAGLTRLELTSQITEVFPTALLLPAVGQGALGIETRAEDAAARAAVAALDHRPSHAAVLAERSMLAALRGGCLAPVGGWARLNSTGALRLDAVVLSLDGRTRIAAAAEGSPDEAEQLGRSVAESLERQGAAALVQSARG